VLQIGLSLVDGCHIATPHPQMSVVLAIGTYDSCCVSPSVSLAAADSTTSPIYYQCQAGMEQSNVAACDKYKCLAKQCDFWSRVG